MHEDDSRGARSMIHTVIALSRARIAVRWFLFGAGAAPWLEDLLEPAALRHELLVADRGRSQRVVDHNASFPGDDGCMQHVQLDGVAVTPSLPRLINNQQSSVDRMTGIVRIRLQGN